MVSSDSLESAILFILEKNPSTTKDIDSQLRKAAKIFKFQIPDRATLIKIYRDLVASSKIPPNPKFESALKGKESRTLSGVAPVSLMTAPMGCPSDCLYCPTEAKMPKSYLSNQPGPMRAALSKFDPYIQTISRLNALYANGHSPEKIEIIVNGGTWSAHPARYKTWFINEVFKACNNFVPSSIRSDLISADENREIISSNLESLNFDSFKKLGLSSKDDSAISEELLTNQKVNETSKWRIIGITLETRPDHITVEEINHMRKLGCTKVELGVQTLSDEVQKLNNRGHDTEVVVQATRLLRNAGFKIAYHMMPNLYGSTPELDIQMFKTLFSDSRFQPDFLKIYPCLALEEAKLFKLLQEGSYIPYPDNIIFNVLLQAKLSVPKYCRISRLMRDIPSDSIKGGITSTNIREDLQAELKRRGQSCICIRCRESKKETVNPEKAVLTRADYKAGDGREIFLSFESKDSKEIYAFARLYIPEKESNDLIDNLHGCSIIRELHSYGRLLPVSHKEASGSSQHLGFGKLLLKKAEEIVVAESSFRKLAVISGIGVREYYRKLGYIIDGNYMVKSLPII